MVRSKLLLISDYYLPHWTGIARAVFNFTKGISKYYNVTILTVRFDKKLKKEDKYDNVKIFREDPIFTISRSKYSLNFVFKFIQLVKDYDIIIVNSPCSNIIFVSIVSKLFRKKLIIFNHGDLILPKGLINTLIMKAFDLSSFVSFTLADIISTFTIDYANNSRVIKPFLYKFKSVLWPVYLPSGKVLHSAKFKALYKLKSKGHPIFGFSGRFVEEKGFDILLDAINIVKNKNNKIFFVYAGDTNIGYENFYSNNLNKIEKVLDQLTFLGLLKEQEMRTFYSLIDFIIVPSRSDCFPLVLEEAMLSSVPAIVSDIPGARFLVKQTGFGMLVKKENAEDLAKKIIEAIGKRRKLNFRKNRVENILNNNKNVEKIKDIIG